MASKKLEQIINGENKLPEGFYLVEVEAKDPYKYNAFTGDGHTKEVFDFRDEQWYCKGDEDIVKKYGVSEEESEMGWVVRPGKYLIVDFENSVMFSDKEEALMSEGKLELEIHGNFGGIVVWEKWFQID